MTKTARVYDETVKIMLLGESGVGKSSLLLRFTEDKFASGFQTTLGVEYKQKTEKIDGKRVSIQVWDTAGQEKFRTITPIYYKNIEGVMLVFDMCDTNSFEGIAYWMDKLNENADKNSLKIMLIANKADMAEKRTVTKEQGEELAKKYGIKYAEASAKSKTNINEIFLELTKSILANKQGASGKVEEKDVTVKLKEEKSSKKKGCC